MVALCQQTMRPVLDPLERLDTLMSTLCAEHRRGWALLLLRGGMGLDGEAAAHPEPAATEAERALDHFLAGKPSEDFEG